jgi:hypothetical protein
MRPLALVLTVTLLGCVRVPTPAHAHAGNFLYMMAGIYMVSSAMTRDCDYHRMDIGEEAVAEIGCELGTNIEQIAGVGVLISAMVGIGRTLYRPVPATTTPRSR